MPALDAVSVLLVEDDERMAEILRRGLGREGAQVTWASTVADGLDAAASGAHDVLVLDVTLPDDDGFELVRTLRGQGRWTPVLMLTARDELEDRVEGFEAGADDYLGKPFQFVELLARLRALVRRDRRPRDGALAIGDLALDPETHVVTRAGAAIELSAREFDLLEVLMRHRGEVLSRWQLLEEVWPRGVRHPPNVVDVYVRYLREKIDRPFGRETLTTVRSRGYRLTDDRG